MLLMHDHTLARPGGALAGIAASLATLLVCFALLAAAAPSTASAADCTSGGSSCLPGTGYGSDVTWACSINTGTNCYYNNTTSSGSARSDSWGWGSASYSGAGSVFVCIQGSGYFVGCAYTLARACYYASCDDQDLVSFLIYVRNESGVTHTIDGHAMA